MHRRLAAMLALLLTITGVAVISLASASAAQAKDVDCGDFNTQAAAQQYFLNHGGPDSDPDGLDAEGDGIACESNPCPCFYGTGNGGGGNENPPAPTKKSHVIKLRLGVANGKDKILGNVPTYRGQFQVQRKVVGGKFKFFTRTKAVNPGGKVQLAVKGSAKTCFKVIVPATKRYKVTSKDVGCL